MWQETKTKYGYNVVTNEGGTTLGYCPESGVKIIEKDGFAFKDMAKCGELLPYEDWRLPAEVRAEDLGKRLSVEHIAGLMCYSAHQLQIDKELNEGQKTFLNEYVRSVLNSAGLAGIPSAPQIPWANAMQKYAEALDFAIPCYIASDPRNGCDVADWPNNLSLAATFDPSLAKEAAKGQSIELRDLGIACFLAPQVDIAADPRWYRDNGTFGEDPALSRDMVRAFCDGLQSTYGPDGEDLGWGKDSMTAMVKHWTGEGASEGGREAHMEGGKFAVYPNRNFEALMVPFVDGAFKLDGKTGSAAAVMSSYSISYSEDGSLGEKVGSGYSDYKINQLLRKRYGFSGPVCTDWMILNEGMAEGRRACGWGTGIIEDPDADPGERALLAILAGVDQMGGCSNPKVLRDAYAIGCEKYGKEFMDAKFAESAKRLLVGYFLTGMFDNPYIDEDASLADVNSADKQAAALAAQVKSIIMLKNEGNVIKPSEKRMKVYMPALRIDEHDEFNHHTGITHMETAVTYPIRLSVAEKYFDVITDKVEGNVITRLTAEEIKGCDLTIIPVKEPVNLFPQDGRDTDKNWVPVSLQYRPYTADGPNVRKVSIAGNQLPDGSQENRSYYGNTGIVTNEGQLDQVLELSAVSKAAGVPTVACIFTGKPLCVYEFEPYVDAMIMTFSIPSLYGGSDTSSEALAIIAAGLAEPSALLPLQMPKDMNDVEGQAEDTPRDMECYTDAAGHKYDFAYGMNWSGVINDERVAKYSAPALTSPANKGVQ